MTEKDKSFASMSVIEKVRTIENLHSINTPNHEIKAQLSLSRHDLSHLLRISRKLSERVKTLIHKSHLSEGHAKALTRLNHEQQDGAARDAISKHWSVRRLEQEVKTILEGRGSQEDSNYYEILSENISAQIGHPVKVIPTKNDHSIGVIEIRYLGFDAFDSILDRMKIRLEEQY